MNNDTNNNPYNTRYKELERTTGEINSMPYTILKLEYKDLDYLIENDLLCNGETGRFLSAFIGLTSKQKVPFEADGFGLVCPMYLDKETTDLFGDKENITKIITFDLNRCWGTPIQLDMDFCLKKITELVQCIKKHNREENLTNTPPQINYESLLNADKGFRTKETLESLIKDIAKEYKIDIEQARRGIEKELQKETQQNQSKDSLIDSKQSKQELTESSTQSREQSQSLNNPKNQEQSKEISKSLLPKTIPKKTDLKKQEPPKEQGRGR